MIWVAVCVSHWNWSGSLSILPEFRQQSSLNNYLLDPEKSNLSAKLLLSIFAMYIRPTWQVTAFICLIITGRSRKKTTVLCGISAHWARLSTISIHKHCISTWTIFLDFHLLSQSFLYATSVPFHWQYKFVVTIDCQLCLI